MGKIWIPLICILCGCTLASVQVEVVSERTTLENQVLGTYNALDTEMLLLASVRGVDAAGNIRPAPQHSREHKDAVAAMQIMAFHADDVTVFKQLGWVGETNRGLLQAFGLEKERIPGDARAFADRFTQAEFDAVVSQVNDARQVIMNRVVEMNDHLTAADLPEVGKIFGKLNADTALSGEQVQAADGKWERKP